MNWKVLLKKPKLKRISLCLVVLYVLYISMRYVSRRQARDVPAHARYYLTLDEKHTVLPARTALNASDIAALARRLDKRKRAGEVLHRRRYGPIASDATVIAVQVHRDAERLQRLIASLAQAHRIQQALLVFSHSDYDAVIDGLVSGITFCRVIQLFYPHSVQLQPGGHAGAGGERQRHKQHWWWKANYIFEDLERSHQYKGIVVFLEEHDRVVPDALHMLEFARRYLARVPGLDVVALGGAPAAALDADAFTVDAWRPPYDAGLAFTATTWRRIRALAEHYCMYADASWSYSLLNVFGKFPRGRADMLACAAPRVLLTATQRLPAAELFPRSVRAVMVYSQRGRVARSGAGCARGPRAAGGWEDVRDHLLCLDPLGTTLAGDDDDATTSSPVFT